MFSHKNKLKTAYAWHVCDIVRGEKRKERKSVRAGGCYNCESDIKHNYHFLMSHTAAQDTTPTLTQGAAEI